jgi:glycosyltransferase involved in cell wall biosynthesis
MKILMVSSSYPRFPGDVIAPFIESIVKSIAKKGHEIHLLLPEHPKLMLGEEKGISFHIYRYAPADSLAKWGYAQSLEADERVRGGIFLLAPLALGSLFFSMLSLVRKYDFDLIQANWLLPNGPPAAIAARWSKLPLVVSLHGSDVFLSEKRWDYRKTARFALESCDWLTASSDDLRHRALKIGGRKEHSTTIPYGVDPAFFRPDERARGNVRQGLNLSQDHLLVLAVGRLVAKKGFRYLIKAAPQIIAEVPNIRFVIAGSGDLEKSLKGLAGKLKVEEYFLFPGALSRERIPAFMNAADIIAVPSIHDAQGNVDGLPNVVMEALSVKKPVAASSVGGIPSVIENEINGLLFPEKDEQALARGIIRLARSQELREKLAAEARRRIEQEHSWDKVGERYLECFERAIKKYREKRDA